MNWDITFYTLVFSILLQAAAVVLVLRLTRLTRVWSAWALIAVVLGLMTVRRAVTLIGLYAPEVEAAFRGPLAEGIALIISILLLLAIVSVGRLVKQLQAERQSAERQAEALAVRTRRLSTLYAIDRVAAHSLNLDEILSRSLAAVMQTLEIESAGILLLEPDGETLTVRAHRGVSEEFVHNMSQVRVGEGLAGRAVAQGIPITMDISAYASERMASYAEREGFKSMSSTPLVSQGRPIGALNLGSRVARTFTAETLDFLASLGQQLGGAINNALLYEAELARRRELDMLLEVTRALGSSLDLQMVTAAVAQATHKILPVERCAIFLWDEAAEELTPVLPAPDSGLALRLSPDVQPQFAALRVSSRNAPLIMESLLTGHPVVVADVAASPFIPAQWATAFGIQSALVVPLFAQEHFVGGLYTDSSSHIHHFTQHEINLMLAIAGQAALALQNARLFETLAAEKRRLDLLYNLSLNLTTSLDIREVSVRALDLTTSVLGAFKGELFVQERGSDRLRLIAISGYDAESVEALDRRINLRVGQGLAGYTAYVRTLTIVPDVAHDEHWRSVPGVDDWVRSATSLPLVAGDKLVGIINLLSDRESFFRQHDLPMLTAVAVPIALALQNAWLFEASATQNRRLRRLYELAALLTGDPQTVFDRVAAIAAELLATPMVTIERVARDQIVVVAMWLEGQIRHEGIFPLTGTPCENVASLRQPCRFSQVIESFPNDQFLQEHRIQAYIGVPLLDSQGQVVGVLQAMDISERTFTDDDEHFLAILGQRVGAELERQRELEEKEQLFVETRRRAEELETLAHLSSALRQAQTRDTMLPIVVEQAMKALRADAGTLILLEEDVLVFHAAHGINEALKGRQHPSGDDPLWQVMRTGEPLLVSDIAEHGEFTDWEICRTLAMGLTAHACVPLKTAEGTAGLLYLACHAKRVASQDDIRLLVSIAEMAGNAIHRAALHEQTERRLQYLATLRAIDIAISTSLDLHVTLNILLDQVTTQLRVDAADVLLLDPHAQTLEYAAGRGFRSAAGTHVRARLGEGNAGRAALERRIVHSANLSETKPSGQRTGLLTSHEAFVAYYAVPLIAKGKVKGVLEIFHHAPVHTDLEWLDFLEALAVQTAIAVDNAELFQGLQRSNVELAVAYDTTIEGWARALELRDQETEGHSQRVTELALRLARAMGISEEYLVLFRRGALLHDIGKMGIPDVILLKPDALTEEEWTIMRKHPIYAYDMLSPIAYLRPALDIPYCHHEKWDGTGYPRGLKGDQIPLAARIFTVVDVWDALRSDRPYRAAWPEEVVWEYIREQSGKHFDPQVVEAFLKIER